MLTELQASLFKTPPTDSSRTAATPLRAGVVCQKWRDNVNSLASPAAAAEPNRYMDQKTFEASLKAGQTVRLLWQGQSCEATVERVNRASVAVITKEKMLNKPAGTRILVDRVVSGRRSASNCVRPLD